MKVDLLNESKFPRISGRHRGSVMKKLSVPNYENNNVRNNATVSKNTCGRISFKANKAHVVEEAISNSIVKNDKLQKLLHYANENNVLTSSIIALFVTCIMRPLAIMVTPTKSEENKQKNKYASAKSIASGVIGFVTTYLIAEPFKNATSKVSKELVESGKLLTEDTLKPTARYIAHTILDKETEPSMKNTNEALIEVAKKIIPDDFLKKVLKNKDKFPVDTPENLKASVSKLTDILADRLRSQKNITEQFLNATSHSPLSIPLKALATISLVPIVLGIFGIKKSSNKNSKPEIKQNITIPQQYRNEINPVFKNIAMTGGIK